MEMFTYEPVDSCVCGTSILEIGPRVEKHFSRGKISFVQCPQCKSWIQSPRVSLPSLTAWYNSSDYQSSKGKKEGPYLDYSADESSRLREAAVRFKRDLKSRLPAGARVLEIGCASGSFLAACRDQGCDVLGIDLAESFVEQAKKLHDLNVTAGDFMTLDLPAKAFDAIILLGTVANLQNLPASLHRIHSMLKPAGFLYFNFPFADCIAARIYGRRYWMFAPSCSQFLTRAGCKAVLQKAGFEIVTSQHDRQMPTLTKLLGHMRLNLMYRLACRLGVQTVSWPVPLPIPGVCVHLCSPALK